MKTYPLAISPAVYDDLVDIRTYISETLCNPEAAQSIVSDLLDAIQNLSKLPLRGTLLKTVLPLPVAYRFIPCHKYLIFYRLTEEDTVFVSRILLRSRNHWRLLLQDDFPAEWDE